MLRLAKKLNSSIASGSKVEDVQREAKFLVETEVLPRMAEVEAVIDDPKKHWYRKAADVAKMVPEVVLNCDSQRELLVTSVG